MASLQEKIANLLKKIQQNAYVANQLTDMLKLQAKIAQDIECDDPAEAMAVLGYLFKYEYIKVDPKKGIVLNEDKKNDIDLIMKG